MKYWLSHSRDFHGSLASQAIRIEWLAGRVTHTATGDLDEQSIRWTNVTADVPADLAALAAECAIDAYEYGVDGCDYEGQETANEQWIAVDDAWARRRRQRDHRMARHKEVA